MAISEIDAVVCETQIQATPATVFSFFTDQDKMARWMGVRASIEPRPGGTYAVDINPATRARGAYLEVVPYSRIVFTFGWEGEDQPVPPGSSTVEVTLTPVGEGTHVRLVHRGLTTMAQRDLHREGWQLYLARLTVAAPGGAPGPDPNANPPEES